jgi:hypothetical protein
MVREQCAALVAACSQVVAAEEARRGMLESALEQHALFDEVDELSSWVRSAVSGLQVQHADHDVRAVRALQASHQALLADVQLRQSDDLPRCRIAAAVLRDPDSRAAVGARLKTVERALAGIAGATADVLKRLDAQVLRLQFMTELDEADAYLTERSLVAERSTLGADVPQTQSLLHDNAALQRELNDFPSLHLHPLTASGRRIAGGHPDADTAVIPEDLQECLKVNFILRNFFCLVICKYSMCELKVFYFS